MSGSDAVGAAAVGSIVVGVGVVINSVIGAVVGVGVALPCSSSQSTIFGFVFRISGSNKIARFRGPHPLSEMACRFLLTRANDCIQALITRGTMSVLGDFPGAILFGAIPYLPVGSSIRKSNTDDPLMAFIIDVP